MKNVDYKKVGNNLVITINLEAEKTESKSGKSLILATTSGNKKLDLNGYNLKLGLNLYEPKPKQIL